MFIATLPHPQVKRNSTPPLSLFGQLLWREFFYTAATNNPRFDRMEGNPICIQIPWDRNPEALAKWAEGKTGFPWIDAIMTQLRQEGWIHHLARHAVACFLTRGDLWVSWESGVRVSALSAAAGGPPAQAQQGDPRSQGWGGASGPGDALHTLRGWPGQKGSGPSGCFGDSEGTGRRSPRGLIVPVPIQVFDELLLDADFSVNAGSWMWLSCSAFFQQFFHCYCPVGFGRRTDPSGDYIR